MRRPCLMQSVMLSVVLGAALAGCDAAGPSDVQAWMAQQRSQAKVQVTPVSEPKAYTPQAYSQGTALAPFDRDKLITALRSEAGLSSNAALLAPEQARRKEPLEAYPLDTMAMVGSLIKEGKPVALVQVDRLIYQIRPGQYLGQNYGRVMKVSETEVLLREITQDPGGEWVERRATLNLQERTKQ
jgi:type IV pilus assembly protein PilP